MFWWATKGLTGLWNLYPIGFVLRFSFTGWYCHRFVQIGVAISAKLAFFKCACLSSCFPRSRSLSLSLYCILDFLQFLSVWYAKIANLTSFSPCVIICLLTLIVRCCIFFLVFFLFSSFWKAQFHSTPFPRIFRVSLCNSILCFNFPSNMKIDKIFLLTVAMCPLHFSSMLMCISIKVNFVSAVLRFQFFIFVFIIKHINIANKMKKVAFREFRQWGSGLRSNVA